jgi:putative membrane protein
MGGGMMGFGGGMGGLGGGSMFGFGLIGLVLIIVVVVLVAKSWSGGGPAGRSGEDRALAILKERYARGEIDKTEFDARKRDLT